MNDPSLLLERLEIERPLVGLYDAPDTVGFEPVVTPDPKQHRCIFSFYPNWMRGETLLITKDNFGCGGAGTALCSMATRTRDEYISFLVDTEGLKASREIMGAWLDQRNTYKPRHPCLFVGPLRSDTWSFLKTITFFVNPDQLSALILGANYHSAPADMPAVIAPFGSGCMELITPFQDLSIPQAIIGATDIAMRSYLPPDILAFTVTMPMFSRLCSLDEKSFLYKPFLKNLKKARSKRS
ncbi:MAG TPA: hypothetical protein ENN34_04475 [Deltaproteobacteria bacterium]|nr:hypothetical protein [Deltaproteobacteria bacterium]